MTETETEPIQLTKSDLDLLRGLLKPHLDYWSKLVALVDCTGKSRALYDHVRSLYAKLE